MIHCKISVHNWTQEKVLRLIIFSSIQELIKNICALLWLYLWRRIFKMFCLNMRKNLNLWFNYSDGLLNKFELFCDGQWRHSDLLMKIISLCNLMMNYKFFLLCYKFADVTLWLETGHAQKKNQRNQSRSFLCEVDNFSTVRKEEDFIIKVCSKFRANFQA